MPLYSYICTECGNEAEAVNRVDDRRTNAPRCHGRMDIKLQPVSGYMQRDCNYTCPVTGGIVTSARQRKYIMESRDLQDANDFKSNFAKQKAQHARLQRLAGTLSQPITDEKTIAKMSEHLTPLTH